MEDHRDLFDVKLTAIILCEEKDCEEQNTFFKIGEMEELTIHRACNSIQAIV